MYKKICSNLFEILKYLPIYIIMQRKFVLKLFGQKYEQSIWLKCMNVIPCVVQYTIQKFSDKIRTRTVRNQCCGFGSCGIRTFLVGSRSGLKRPPDLRLLKFTYFYPFLCWKVLYILKIHVFLNFYFISKTLM
jgi:hypothetical protein